MSKKLTAMQYLGQLEEIDTNINQNLERLDEMKHGALCSGAIDYSKDRVQTSPVNALEKRVCSYIDYEEKLNQEIDRFVDAKERIISEIRGLHNPIYSQILFKVYVQYKTLKCTSQEMQRSYMFVSEKHKEALAAFENTYTDLYYLT